MSGLAFIVVASAILAVTARSFWRLIFEAGVLVLLFVLFVGILTLVTEGRVAFYGG